ncbi:FAD-dependent monooxygenase [Hymenobacter weizhouensis]|uniref:FAD-dependent monooxygenase n=1 Tax=Hymenobacter sp. YIM 151500-1 TaxID=2987689 RepID=UPI002225F077|nr:FAD-dependent monooxygenase [Hymenobacter sp. YIM 151500-1]UYZ64828.1 FAD-dependent monooxygenase [Hymenobacter sp. YIM 151500-1]
MNQSVVISGGGIAGLAAANMLHKAGYAVTVLEKAHAFTNAGYLLSLKSFGIDIMGELGLEANLVAAQVPASSLSFLDAKGRPIRKLNIARLHQEGGRSILVPRAGGEVDSLHGYFLGVRSILIPRATLHRVMYEAVQDKVRVIFGATVETVQQTATSVAVTLSNGETLDADFFIIAEGLRSATRNRYVANAQVEDFNVFYMGGKLAGRHQFTPGVNRIFMGVGKMLFVFPVAEDELAIQCYIQNTDDVAQLQANAKHLLRYSFAGFPDEVRTLVEEIATRGILYADKMGMVHAPELAQGRIVLLGDAAYCPTALSGMGASLSIYGARVLTHFVGQLPHDLPLAFTRYSAWMQPIVQKFQDNAKQNARSLLPKNNLQLQAFKLFLRLAPEAVLLKKVNNQLVLSDEQMRF